MINKDQLTYASDEMKEMILTFEMKLHDLHKYLKLQYKKARAPVIKIKGKRALASLLPRKTVIEMTFPFPKLPWLKESYKEIYTQLSENKSTGGFAGYDRKFSIRSEQDLDTAVEIIKILHKLNYEVGIDEKEPEEQFSKADMKIMMGYLEKIIEISEETRDFVKRMTPQIEELLSKQDNLEEYLKEHLASDWEQVKDLWEQYKTRKISKGKLIKEVVKVGGKKFIKKLLGKGE